MSLVVVTGGSGLVGANLVRDLVREGRQVRVLVRATPAPWRGCRWSSARCDIRDAPAVADAVAGAEVVYHVAGSISVGPGAGGVRRRRQRRRHRSTWCVPAGSGGVGRLVYCSSIHALDFRPDEVAVDEERPLWTGGRRCSAYDLSKASAERVVLEAVREGLDAVIVSPTAIIGPCDFKPSWMGRFLVRLSHGRQPVLMDAGFDWVDARDVAAGARAAAERGRPGERYLLSGHWCSLSGLAGLAAGSTAGPPGTSRSRWRGRKAGPARARVANRLVGRVTPITPEAVEAMRHCRLVSSAKAVASSATAADRCARP